MTITCENCGTIMPDPDQSIRPVMKLTNATLRSMIDNSGFDFSALPDMAGTTAGRVGHSSSSVARVLVDLYYSMQDQRKAVANKLRAIDQGADVDASDDDEVGSSAVSRFVLSQIDVLERNSKGFVEEYATRHAL